jgi:hypothetical protein
MDSKPVKEEVNSTVILTPLVFPGSVEQSRAGKKSFHPCLQLTPFLRIPLFPVLLDQSSEKADLDCQTKAYHHKMSMAKQNVIPTKPEF